VRFAIYGSGGVGGYYGARLAQAGHDVTFIARNAHLHAMRHGGLRLRSALGDVILPRVQATADPKDVEAVDAVLIGVKTWQLPDVIEGLPAVLRTDTAVITTQNGVDAPEELASAVGRHHVLPGLVKLFTSVSAPGHIEHIGGPGSITFSEWDNRSSDRVTRLRQAFMNSGVTVETTPDITAALWTKFLFVTSFGGLGALTRVPIGILRGMPETRSLLTECMHEIRMIAERSRIALPADIVARTLAFIDQQPEQGISSLHRDIAAGRRSELDAWNGAIARRALKIDVPAPINTFIYHSLLPLERLARVAAGG